MEMPPNSVQSDPSREKITWPIYTAHCRCQSYWMTVLMRHSVETLDVS